jgi:Tol biopolymer transport system component
VTPSETQAVSPSGRYLAFSYAAADSVHLALLDLTTRTLQRVHALAGTATYSLAWHPDSRQARLAFGYYRPVENGTRGPGSIRIATPGGKTRSVGCSAAREVLDWLPGGALATRTDDKLYVVAADGCATQASLDARRMHLTHYAPDGEQMAYIHRELRYDREAEDYVPDSSLVLSGPRGEKAKTLFKDKRHARHFRWSPTGAELALDVAVQESGHRQVVVYDGTRPTFLVPPNQTTADQLHPRWSPSGDRLAFTLRTATSTYAAVRVQGQTRRLGRTRGPVWGWLDERAVVVPGPDSVRVQTLSGTTRFTHPTPSTLLYVWRTPVS